MMNNLPSGILYSLTGAAAVASLTSCATGKQKEEQKPLNIVYIMTLLPVNSARHIRS